MALVQVAQPRKSPAKQPDYRCNVEVKQMEEGARESGGRFFKDVGAAWFNEAYEREGESVPARLFVKWAGEDDGVELRQDAKDAALFASEDGSTRAEVRAGKNGQYFYVFEVTDPHGGRGRTGAFHPNQFKHPQAGQRPGTGFGTTRPSAGQGGEAKAAEPVEVSAEQQAFDEAVLAVVQAVQTEDGAQWDAVLERSQAEVEGSTQVGVEEALGRLMDAGRIFEPTLGVLRTT